MFDAVTIDQLRVLLAVHESGSFSAAARQLSRTQSAISQAVANLERLLDLQLFDRSGRRPTPTGNGMIVIERAREVLRANERLHSAARTMADGVEASMAIAVDEMFPFNQLSDVLERFTVAFPGVSVTVRGAVLGASSEQVIDGTCDFGICGPLGQKPAELDYIAMNAVTMFPVVSGKHPLAQSAQSVTVEELRQHIQLILIDRSPLTSGTRVGVLSERCWYVDTLALRKEFLLAGIGWATMPAHLVNAELASGALVRIYPDVWLREDHQVSMHVAVRRGRTMGPAARWFVESLIQSSQSSLPEPLAPSPRPTQQPQQAVD